MNGLGLTASELESIRTVIARNEHVTCAIVYGSRAKGTHRHNSDVDIALDGTLSALEAESIAGELEELPLPYHFDVVALPQVTNEALRSHIQRVGIRVFK